MFLFRLEREHNTFLYNANTVEHVLTVLLDRVILLPIGYTHVQINRAGGIYEERTVSALGKIGKCKT